MNVCVYTCASVLAHQSTGSRPILPVGLIPSQNTHAYTQSFSHLASHVKYYVTRAEPGPLAQTLVTEYSRLGSGVTSEGLFLCLSCSADFSCRELGRCSAGLRESELTPTPQRGSPGRTTFLPAPERSRTWLKITR